MNAAVTSFDKVTPSALVGMGSMSAMADSGNALLSEVRARMFSPQEEKSTPYFTQAELCAMLGKDFNWLSYRLRTGDEPGPEMVDRKNRFSLASMQAWARRHRSHAMRPGNHSAIAVAIGNFKGGSTKTTTAVTVAQGLTIRGHKVLLVDLDPQGSASCLMGVLPHMPDIKTLLPVFQGEENSVEPMIRKTYWPNLDLIAATTLLAQAELDVLTHPGGRWWEVLKNALQPVMGDYDVVVFDTNPTLSPLTVSAFMAADGVVVPITPNALDFASSTQFWTLFADMHATFERLGFAPKEYEFVKVLLSRVDSNDTATAMVREFIELAYGEHAMKSEVPKSNVATSSSMAFGTVFDTQVNRSSKPAFARFREASESVVDEMEMLIRAAWARREVEGV